MIGNRHLHEGTIGTVFVVIGVIWNIWHFFDENFYFPFTKYATIGWWLAVGGMVFIALGAILIGRDWEDVKNFRFFNTEDEKKEN
jgi:membrane associated rhomboid family serine protease